MRAEGLASGIRRAPARIVLDEQPPRFQEMVRTWCRLAGEDYVGLTTDGAPRHDLFPIRDTGLSCAAAVAAARAFLASLDAEAQARARFDIDDRAWRQWSNIHRNVMRHGACLDVMSDAQRRLALELVQACVSVRIFGEIVNTMRLNEHTGELTGKPDQYGEWFYYLSIFGEPSDEAPWGWQMDGHHCNINCFVLGGQMVLTPMLLGAEPVAACSGRYEGAQILREEEAAGLKMMRSLSPEQQSRACLGTQLPFDGLGSGFKDNLQVAYEGIGLAQLAAHQRELLLDVVRLFVNRLPPAHAICKMQEIAAGLDELHFAWIGRCDDDSPFYYRIHSPAAYIEFFHQPGIAQPEFGFSRRHAHGLMRTPNGNDYGRVLLARYRAQHGGAPSRAF